MTEPATGTEAIGAEADRLVDEVERAWPKDYEYSFKPENTPPAKALLLAPREVRVAAVFILLERIGSAWSLVKDVASFLGFGGHGGRSGSANWYSRAMLAAVLRSSLPFSANDGERLFSWLAARKFTALFDYPMSRLVRVAEDLASSQLLTNKAMDNLRDIREGLAQDYRNPEVRKLVNRLDAVLGRTDVSCIEAGEVWADQALSDLQSMDGTNLRAWTELLRCARTASGSRPSGKWEKVAAKLMEAVGPKSYSDRVITWFALVERPRTAPWPAGFHPELNRSILLDANVDVLRGLVWMTPLAGNEDLRRSLGRLCESSLKKIPGMGPRAPKLANATVWALGRMGDQQALAQLARLKTRVRFRTTLSQIEKALDAAAAKLGVTRDDLEEMGVPTFGFDASGVLHERFGGSTVELRISGRSVTTTWANEKGKKVKSPPAAAKTQNADEIKQLKAVAVDAEKMLVAQRDRLDSMFLPQKAWPIATWRERYLDHPLVGTIARRLIWNVDGTAAVFLDAKPLDVDGKPIEHGSTAVITLWHPVGQSIEAVTAWRRRLEELGITQPFKQAHREVYLLTDAERRTRTYSNRFAAHVIRQHQFNALCAARGWKNKLRLMVDDVYPPATKTLPVWGLRAEFWIEGIGQDFGTDTNESGVYLRLATDQVRFYRIGADQNLAHAGGGGYGRGFRDAPAEPIAIEEVPTLVFSEIMRDVDLFVGVASVGNDPTWQDGGPQGRYQNYWQSYSFGDLGESAKTRKAVLERLIPRLKIADRCTFSDKFLVVRGSLRTYKIHLGSGNILMEPNDQYLCIVADARARSNDNDLFLPFEGDNTLSIILSKAFLLAEDSKIKDSTITRQIGGAGGE